MEGMYGTSSSHFGIYVTIDYGDAVVIASSTLPVVMKHEIVIVTPTSSALIKHVTS